MSASPTDPGAHVQRGFTLIECVVVLVVISVGLLGVAGLFSTALRALNADEALQTVGQFAQACAEEVLTYHHKTNLAAVATLPPLCTQTRAGATRTVTVSAPYLNESARPWCPNHVTCRDVAIDVTVDIASPPRSTIRARIDLMLTAY